MYYASIGILALLLLIIENHDILSKNSRALEIRSWAVYRKFLTAIIIYYASDILWGLFDYYNLSFGLFVDTTIYFISISFGLVLWTSFVISYIEDNNLFSKFLFHGGHLVAFIVVISTIVNAFYPVVFSISSGDYKPLIFRYVLFGVQIAFLALVTLYSFVASDRRKSYIKISKRYNAVAYFGIIMVSFLFLQLLFPFLPLYSIAYMLGTSLLRSFVIANEREEFRHDLEKKQYEVRIKEEKIASSRITALVSDFLCIYIVDPKKFYYREFTSTQSYDAFNLPKDGKDFFETTRADALHAICREDLDRFLSKFTKENVLASIESDGLFSMTYKIYLNGKENYVQLRIVKIKEDEDERLIVGIQDIDEMVRQEETYAKRLEQAQNMAKIDGLTGVKNKQAFSDEEKRLDHLIRTQDNAFAIVVMDVNDLKKVNDNHGHQAGDDYLRTACKIICNIFKKSPVFRIGGDEFAVVTKGEDYYSIDELMLKMSVHNMEAKKDGGVVIACGMAKYEKDDTCSADIFKRADERMYENKSMLKAVK